MLSLEIFKPSAHFSRDAAVVPILDKLSQHTQGSASAYWPPFRSSDMLESFDIKYFYELWFWRDLKPRWMSKYMGQQLSKNARPLPRVHGILWFAIEWSAKAQAPQTRKPGGKGCPWEGPPPVFLIWEAWALEYYTPGRGRACFRDQIQIPRTRSKYQCQDMDFRIFHWWKTWKFIWSGSKWLDIGSY